MQAKLTYIKLFEISSGDISVSGPRKEQLINFQSVSSVQEMSTDWAQSLERRQMSALFPDKAWACATQASG